MARVQLCAVVLLISHSIIFYGQHDSSTLASTMGSLAMQIFENNNVINSHRSAWRIRRFWLDVINCERFEQLMLRFGR